MKREYDFTNANRGAVIEQKGKSRITIYIDSDILANFRTRADEAGYGYQTMINEALRQFLDKSTKLLDETTLRQVMREELERVAQH